MIRGMMKTTMVSVRMMRIGMIGDQKNLNENNMIVLIRKPVFMNFNGKKSAGRIVYYQETYFTIKNIIRSNT